MINTALEVEMAEHVGDDKHDPAGRNGQNSRNGRRTKTVLTEAGPDIDDVFPAGIACATSTFGSGEAGANGSPTPLSTRAAMSFAFETAPDRP